MCIYCSYNSIDLLHNGVELLYVFTCASELIINCDHNLNLPEISNITCDYT